MLECPDRFFSIGLSLTGVKLYFIWKESEQMEAISSNHFSPSIWQAGNSVPVELNTFFKRKKNVSFWYSHQVTLCLMEIPFEEKEEAEPLLKEGR